MAMCSDVELAYLVSCQGICPALQNDGGGSKVLHDAVHDWYKRMINEHVIIKAVGQRYIHCISLQATCALSKAASNISETQGAEPQAFAIRSATLLILRLEKLLLDVA